MGKTNFSVISPFEEKLINEKSLSSELERLLWEQRESNPRPSACKADALNQLSYAPFLLLLPDNCVGHRSLFFAVRTGLEPATPGVTGRYSNQLNYRTKCSDF